MNTSDPDRRAWNRVALGLRVLRLWPVAIGASLALSVVMTIITLVIPSLNVQFQMLTPIVFYVVTLGVPLVSYTGLWLLTTPLGARFGMPEMARVWIRCACVAGLCSSLVVLPCVFVQDRLHQMQVPSLGRSVHDLYFCVFWVLLPSLIQGSLFMAGTRYLQQVADRLGSVDMAKSLESTARQARFWGWCVPVAGAVTAIKWLVYPPGTPGTEVPHFVPLVTTPFVFYWLYAFWTMASISWQAASLAPAALQRSRNDQAPAPIT